ncbi:hypothetical protein D3C71_2062830 [compost metagenome]
MHGEHIAARSLYAGQHAVAAIARGFRQHMGHGVLQHRAKGLVLCGIDLEIHHFDNHCYLQ